MYFTAASPWKASAAFPLHGDLSICTPAFLRFPSRPPLRCQKLAYRRSADKQVNRLRAAPLQLWRS